jgi:dipeptidyl aminopeptidase/acylaminoacyl peptidase
MNKITAESLYDLKSISQPVIAGKYAFYLETTMNKEDNNYVASIYRIDLETKERTLFGDTGSMNSALQISPDKKKLSYLSNNTKDEKAQLMTIPLTGGSATQVTYEENGISNYFWLDDSQTIYYQTTVEEEKEEKSEEATDLPEKQVVTKLNYKMDSRGVTPEDRLYQIKKIAIDADDPELIHEENRSLSLGYVAKDESYLLYFDRLDPDDEWVYGGSVYKFDIATKNVELLTEEVPGGSFGFDLANEAEDYFIFTGNDFEYKFVTDDHVYGYDLSAKKLTDLTPNLPFGVGDSLVGDFQQNPGSDNVWWLEDGQSFLFKATEHGKVTLYRGTVDGEVEKVFDENIHITGLDLLEDTTQAVITYSTLTSPGVIASLDLKTSTVTDLYNPNAAYFEEVAISQPERFWYKSVRDWDVQGWYVPPVDAKANHPAVLYIHGGPQVSYGETFFHEMQALASKGYGVILLNPRGGSGYGQDFVASILNNYGDEDYQDLMNGTDFVLENHPEIDQDNLYVVGGSYGGFMTNWIVTQTDRFKAAVTQRSISNWLSFYGTSDIGPAFVEFQLGRDLSDAKGLWDMSPLAHTENAKTPLLVIHGEDDLRCPLEQGQQMYIAMKKQRVETRFVTFPKSSHGLSRNGLPNLRMERLEEIVNWFETH